MPRKTASDVLAAVHAARLYIGCEGRLAIHDQQKLYNRMTKRIDAVARKRGMDRTSAHDQIVDAAKRLGGICPIPGRDI